MKAFALALVALMSTVQTVGWVECCCALICKHRNDPCKDECKPAEPAPGHDCCEKPASSSAKASEHRPAPTHDHDKRCAHVEPSSEVASEVAALPHADFDLVLPLPEPIAPVRECEKTDRLFLDLTGSSPPLLHLLYGTLLI